MGRLHHLQQTLPANLLNSESYIDREFVILNYNSQDQLHEWMPTLGPWLDRGVVRYFRTKIPQHFSATHAKNIAHKQATGDIVCNIDADNYVVEGFCEYLADLLADGNTLFHSYSTDVSGNHGCCGKIAVRKEHFLSVNGYDEEQSMGWGWEDVSFRYRVIEHNKLRAIRGDFRWNYSVGHDNDERIKNFQNKNILDSQDWSVSRLMELSVKNEYVVNKNKNWGYVEDLTQHFVNKA